MWDNRKYSDDEIVEILKRNTSGENELIRFLLRSYSPMIKKLVHGTGGSETDCEIVIQEAMVELIYNIKTAKFKGNSKISTYYYSICKNRWSNLKRKRREHENKVSSIELFKNLPLEQHSPSDDKGKEEVLKMLLSLVSEKCKSVLIYWSRSYTMEEIAEEMGYKNAQIAMNKKNTCLKSLMKEISENESLRKKLKNRYDF